MTDIEDTRDQPTRRRVGQDAHTDWMMQRMSEPHQQWLAGNGRLMPLYFTSGWEIHANGAPIPEQGLLDQIVEQYNAHTLQIAQTRNAPTYRQFFKAMEAYEASLGAGLTQQYPTLSAEQATCIVDICRDFRARLVSNHFKTEAERRQNNPPSRP